MKLHILSYNSILVLVPGQYNSQEIHLHSQHFHYKFNNSKIASWQSKKSMTKRVLILAANLLVCLYWLPAKLFWNMYTDTILPLSECWGRCKSCWWHVDDRVKVHDYALRVAASILKCTNIFITREAIRWKAPRTRYLE